MISIKQSSARRLTTILFLIASLSFLYCFLFTSSIVPIEGNGGGDALLNLAPGQRMYQGELIYRDVFEFLTPGTALVNYFMFKLFGLRTWIPNLQALIVGLGLIWIGVIVSRKLVKPAIALLPSAIFLVAARTFLHDPTHHWFSVFASMAALVVLLEARSSTRIAAAGFFCGLSASFTQTHGFAVLMGFAFYLWWESGQSSPSWRGLFKNEALLVASFAAAFLVINGYFIWEAGLARYFWCTVVFVVKYYPKEVEYNILQVYGSELPAYISLRAFLYPFVHWLLLIVATPFIYLFFFGFYWKNRSQMPLEHWKRPMMVALVGFSIFLSFAPSPNPNRIATCELPALILLGWFLNSNRASAKYLRGLIAIGTIIVAIYSVAVHRPHLTGIVNTERGKVGVTDPVLLEEYLWIQQHTHASEYFYQLDFADVYFYFDLRNPTPTLCVLDNRYASQGQVTDIIRGLEVHQVRYVLWDPGTPQTRAIEENSNDNRLGRLQGYIRSHYRLVKRFDYSKEIWEQVAQ